MKKNQRRTKLKKFQLYGLFKIKQIKIKEYELNLKKNKSNDCFENMCKEKL